MLENELLNLINIIKIQKCESNYIEIKSAKKGCPKLYDTFSSFSNQSGGGRILFGIDESDDFNICGVYDSTDLQKKIMEQSLQMEPSVRPLCSVVSIENKIVICAEIQEIDNSLKPCYYKGAGRLKGSYIRVGDGDRMMTEYEVYSYEAFRKKIHDELRISERAKTDDIKTVAFEKYMLEVKTKKKNLSSIPEKRLCELQGFLMDDKPTIAGLMMFSDYPQAFFPQLCITAVSVPGTEMSMTGTVGERFIDNARIDGTIIQMLEEAIQFVRKNTRTKTIIDNDTLKRKDKTEYPMIAVRELIINALVHRDYSFHTDSAPITIRIFKNRIEIENPGGLYGRMTLDQLGKMVSDTRNPYIANALEILGETENRYSGIPTVISAMSEYGLPKPCFENERGIFKVTLYNAANESFITNNSDEARIIEYCKTAKSRSEIEKLFDGKYTIAYIMAKFIHPMIDTGKLKLTIPNKPKSKNQKYYTSMDL